MVSYLLVFIGLLHGCAEDPCPRGSMHESMGGLIVTQEEHPTGWGQDQCDLCHSLPSLHRIACSPDVNFDPVRQIVTDMGVDSCTLCHGDNGLNDE